MSINDDITRWFYKGGRPYAVARFLNRTGTFFYSAGIWPRRIATLEVPGRRTGRTISFPVVIAEYQGGRYLVAMLGEQTAWAKNVTAAGGAAVLRHGQREVVHLEPVPAEKRPPILLRYLAVAPGARPHIPLDRNSPPEDVAIVAARLPTFRIEAPRTAARAGAALPD